MVMWLHRVAQEHLLQAQLLLVWYCFVARSAECLDADYVSKCAQIGTWHCNHSTWTTDKTPVVDPIRFGACALPNCGYSSFFSTGEQTAKYFKSASWAPRLVLMAGQLLAVKWGIEKVAGSHSACYPLTLDKKPGLLRVTSRQRSNGFTLGFICHFHRSSDVATPSLFNHPLIPAAEPLPSRYSLPHSPL